jgi:uncharacterized protein YjiS (DUF1127 family)
MSDAIRIYRPSLAAQGLARFNFAGLLRAWLRGIGHARALREMDAAQARDIGVAPGWDRAPEGFGVDPRPLWGIGLTPQPMDSTTRPWSKR